MINKELCFDSELCNFNVTAVKNYLLFSPIALSFMNIFKLRESLRNKILAHSQMFPA